MPKAKVRKFKCSKCDRRFLMAAHLARHQNTLHAAKGKRRIVKKKTAKRAVRKLARRVAAGVRRTRRVAHGEAGLVRGMRVYQRDLVAKHAQVAAQIEAIDRALAALGAASRTPAAKPQRRRGGAGLRRGSLKYYVDRVLRARGRAMAVKDVTAAVQRAGFKSKNKTLGKSVGIAMSQMPNVRKVSRGTFRLK